MEHRQIVDTIILVHEAIHSSNALEKGMDIKIYMVNAFDRVNHSFLCLVLSKFGFIPPFVQWVSTCIGTPIICPLVNGRPSSLFSINMGLRQGFPLSPLLYIIMAYSLSRKLENERTTRNILVLRIVRVVKSINHLQFMNDTILLGGASTIMAYRFKKVMDLFLQVSSGSINYNKCQIYAWNINPLTSRIISRIFYFPYKENWYVFTYLGMLITINSPFIHHWKTVLDKLKNNLN
jgi:hypothetical protein